MVKERSDLKVRIEVKNLSFRYGEQQPEVFNKVNFKVHQGEVISLLGPNGTGKSTLLKCIGGVLRESRGQIFLDGELLSDLSPAYTAGKMAFVPQGQHSPFPYPVREIVMMGRASHLGMFSLPGDKDKEICAGALEQVGISHLADRSCSQISGGEWQLVLVARAIAQESDILLLDEPTSHLDLGNQMNVLNTINRLAKRGYTIIVATHFPDHALMTSNRAALLNKGFLSEMEHPEKMITEETLAHTYGVKVRIIEQEAIDSRKVIVPLLA